MKRKTKVRIDELIRKARELNIIRFQGEAAIKKENPWWVSTEDFRNFVAFVIEETEEEVNESWINGGFQ